MRAIEARAIAVENPALDEAREKFDALADRLHSAETMKMTHAEVEVIVEKDGREVLRLLFQDHLDLRGQARAPVAIEGSDGILRTHHRIDERPLESVFGTVRVQREGVGARGADALHPVDAALNLPHERHSHGVRKLAAEEAAKGSFEETVVSIRKHTGALVAKRQVEQLAIRAAADFDAFYDARKDASRREVAATSSILVISADGKGIPMRMADLREATRKKAEGAKTKLAHRLTKGEKANRKRMACVAAVYTIAPFARTPEDVARDFRPLQVTGKKRPRPENKRVWASVSKEPDEVIAEAFEEALRRDPGRTKSWVVLVDGNKDQLRIVRRLATKHGVKVTIILDVVHVLEYLWKAAYVFHPEASTAAEAWVTERLLRILRGDSSLVAGGIRRSATKRGVGRRAREPADRCANYLLRKKAFLRYDRALAEGQPIATGVIEGACRHLVKDRMEITGARWSLLGAEAILRLRSTRSSADFEEYWGFHLAQEHQRNHSSHYVAGKIPRPNLRIVR